MRASVMLIHTHISSAEGVCYLHVDAIETISCDCAART